MENTKSDQETTNYYSLLNENKGKSKLAKVMNRDDFSEDIDGDTGNDELQFLFDPKIKEEREKRLNEKDKFYKIKKHYHLKDHYQKKLRLEKGIMKIEKKKELTYIAHCNNAEFKLKKNMPLDYVDLNLILRRNYPLLTTFDKKKLRRYGNILHTVNFATFVITGLYTTYFWYVAQYFNVNFRNKGFKIFVFSGFFVIMNLSLNELIKMKVSTYLNDIVLKNKEEILKDDNEYKKTPYNEIPKMYNYERKAEKDLYLQ